MSDKQLSLVIINLLCQILQNLNPMASCSAETVQAGAAQYNYMNSHDLRAAMVYLLCEIQAGGGIASAAAVVIDVVDPVADPGVTSQIWINRNTGQQWYWNDTTGAWVLFIA